MSTNTNGPSCTAVVCAFNEENTLAGVLDTLCRSTLVDEVVVVDDGSTDETSVILRRFAQRRSAGSHGVGHRCPPADVIPVFLPVNRGKGFAMAEGILAAHGKIVLFVDADLLNLNHDHIARILQPLLTGAADMVIGYPSRDWDIGDFVDPLRPLSGERAVWRQDILPLLPLIRDSRFGVETLINLHYRKEKRRIDYVRLAGLIHPIKLEKSGPMAAFGSYTREALQVAQAVAHACPLAMAAFGLDPNMVRQWWHFLGMQLPDPEQLVSWNQRVSSGARRIALDWQWEMQRRGSPWGVPALGAESVGNDVSMPLAQEDRLSVGHTDHLPDRSGRSSFDLGDRQGTIS